MTDFESLGWTKILLKYVLSFNLTEKIKLTSNFVPEHVSSRTFFQQRLKINFESFKAVYSNHIIIIKLLKFSLKRYCNFRSHLILLETVATIWHYLKCFENHAGCLTLFGWFISVNICESGSSLNGKNQWWPNHWRHPFKRFSRRIVLPMSLNQ